MESSNKVAKERRKLHVTVLVMCRGQSKTLYSSDEMVDHVVRSSKLSCNVVFCNINVSVILKLFCGLIDVVSK